MFCNVICSHGMNMSNLCLFEHRSLFGAMVTLTDCLHICFMYETFSLHGIKPRLQNKKKKGQILHHIALHPLPAATACSALPRCEHRSRQWPCRHRRARTRGLRGIQTHGVEVLNPQPQSRHQTSPWTTRVTTGSSRMWDLCCHRRAFLSQRAMTTGSPLCQLAQTQARRRRLMTTSRSSDKWRRLRRRCPHRDHSARAVWAN